MTVVDAAFNYNPTSFCSTDPDPTPVTLQPVGTFASTPPGVVLDAANGTVDISASVPGTYTITHTINSPCTTTFSQNITLNASPSEPQPVLDTIYRCGPGDVTFSVVSQPGETYSWYDNPIGGIKLGMGASLTKNLTATTTVWVESQSIISTCISMTRAPVTGVIRPIPGVTNTVNAFTQCDSLPVVINFTSDVPGTLFTWTCSASSAFINCTSSGALYQWDELMQYKTTAGTQGICPPEWHIPTETDWNTLFTYYTSSGFAGSPLKYSGFSGFDAFLSGIRFNNVNWDFDNFAVMYWSSTEHGSRKAWAHGMNEQNPSVSFYPSHRNNALPVRCIRD